MPDDRSPLPSEADEELLARLRALALERDPPPKRVMAAVIKLIDRPPRPPL